MGVARARLTIMQVAHLHQGLCTGEGAHNLTAFSRSMTANVGLPKIPNKQCKIVHSMHDLNLKVTTIVSSDTVTVDHALYKKMKFKVALAC